MFRRSAALLVCLGSIAAQNLSLGIAGGGAPTNAFENTVAPRERFYSQSADYLIGASIEYHLPAGLSVEADGLFRELHLIDLGGGGYVQHTPVVTWEFPVLAKYRFHLSRFDPFLEAGPAFRTTGNLNDARPSNAGFSAGMGIATRWRAIEIAPTVRYTRWVRDNNVSSGPETKADQIEVLLGISARPRSLGKPLGGRFALGAIVGVTVTHDLPTYSMSAQIVTGPSPAPGLPPQTEQATIYESGLDAFLVGPALEVGLSRRFYVEADALDHPLRYSSSATFADGTKLGPFSGTQATTWELPVLAKYKFTSGRFRPFAEAGPSFRQPVQHISTAGLSAGGGVEIRWRFLKIAPAIRYTKWAKSANLGPQRPQTNQVEFVTGFLL